MPPGATERLAVVIPFYQREPGILCKALESVIAQDASHAVRVIVVDDGSPIPAAQELRNLIADGAITITLVERKNAGPGAARNTGLDHVPAGTPYVAFLDSDNEWSESHVKNALAALDAGADFYFADGRRVWDEQTTFAAKREKLRPEDLGPILYGPVHEYVGDYEVAVLNGLVRTSAVVYRYERFSNSRFLEDISVAEDIHFWLTVGRRARRVAISLDCEVVSGRGVNVFASVQTGTPRRVEVLCDQIEFFNLCLAIPDLGDAARELSLCLQADLRRHLGEELLHHVARGRASLAFRVVRRDPRLAAKMARAAQKSTKKLSRRITRAVWRRLPSFR